MTVKLENLPQLPFSEKAQDFYAVKWNGKYIHYNQNYRRSIPSLVIDGFMLGAGFGLMALSIAPATGALVVGLSLFFMYRTIKNIGKNDLKEAIGHLLGGIDKIDQLPIDNGEIYREVDEQNKTISVTLNFDLEYAYNIEGVDTPPLKVLHTWRYFLVHNDAEKYKKTTTSEDFQKNSMTGTEAAFLEDLIKNRGTYELKFRSLD